MNDLTARPSGGLTSSAEPIVRTSAGLRDALFDEIDHFRRGQGDPQRAAAISKLASQILSDQLEKLKDREASLQAAIAEILIVKGRPAKDRAQPKIAELERVRAAIRKLEV